MGSNFRVTDLELERLVYELNTWTRSSAGEQRKELKRCKKHFLFTYDSLRLLTIGSMNNVLENFPHEFFTLQLKDAKTLERQIEDELFKDKYSMLCRFERKSKRQRRDSMVKHPIEWKKVNHKLRDDKQLRCDQCRNLIIKE